MNRAPGVAVSDLALVIPELILTGAALALILLASRMRRGNAASVGTVVAALAAALASAWALPAEAETGFGGMITQDGYSGFFKILIAAALALAALVSVPSRHESDENEENDAPHAEYHALLLLASAGMMFAVSAMDLLTLYLGLELMTVCSYILVGIHVQRPASNEAAIKYFLVASFASALLLYGISLTYGFAGGTGFTAVASAFSERGASESPLLVGAIALVLGGLAFKIAAVPFHSWAPDAYQGASAPVAAFLAAGSKAAGLAALARVTLVAYGSAAEILSMLIAGLAALSIVVGSITLLAQTDMKRLLAYSSITHAGYAILGLIAGTPAGISATMTYAFFYVFMTLGAFGVVIALGERGATLNGYRGLAAQRPGTAALMLLFLLSLTGIPPTAGFVAKFVVILSAVRAGYLVLAVLAVACSVVSAFVYMRVAVYMFMREAEEPAPSHWPMAMSAALAVAALVTLIGGISPATLMSWAVSP
ncbi:MAG TPA: NADH-quinone oxidoreductase subunit N [Vicinamibacteria bacterium]|nr:NADH-quinone oxidoreductase subunit N [Vicinamibacteria bacterium]